MIAQTIRSDARQFLIPCHLLFILLTGCQQTAEVVPEGQLVGPGIISTEAPEFATTVNAAGDLIFFNRTTPDRSSMRILFARRQSGQWLPADTLPFSTGRYRDVDPFLTADGQRLYFSSDRPTSPVDTSGIFNTWYVDRDGPGWSEAINPGAPLNSDSTEIFITIAASGNAYFTSERLARGIVVSKFVDGQYQVPEQLVMQLRGEPIYASNPCIASDESFLIVAARDPQGNGTPDLFISWNEDGQWTELVNLGDAVNSPYADFAPALSKDDKTLYFSSERPGIVGEQAEGLRPPGDLYEIDLQAVLPTFTK
ncbi:MAG: hypothetical protein R3301_00180 [Saprospiraceae bacterium]|nr:hypothetical protein [Saprospiraceae bacterium]